MPRGGQVVSNQRTKVQQQTLEPFRTDTLGPGTRVTTDEYRMSARLPARDTLISACTMDEASRPELQRETGFVQCLCIPWQGLVALTELASAAAGYVTGEAPIFPRVLRVWAHCQKARQRVAWCVHGDPGHLRPWIPI